MDEFIQLCFLMLIASLSMTAILTPYISRLAHRQNIVDRPGLHKTHHEAKPLLGGLAIFIALVVTMAVFFVLSNLTVSTKILSLLVGAIVLVITGLYDDIYHLKPIFKLTGQVTAALIVVLFNASYYKMFYDTFSRWNIPGAVVAVLLVGWIVLMINAFNLIDGLDGLAVGIGAIIFAAMAVINLLNGASLPLLALQLIGAGACIGFLLYNFNPASIFMGDTGSMLLGYLLASTYIMSISGGFTGSLVLGSIFIFAYPALDTTFAIYRRLRNRTSIFKADKAHIHHILQRLGFSVRKTVIILYLVNLFFAGAAIVLLSLHLSSATLLVLGFITVAFCFFLFRYLTAVSRQNGLQLPPRAGPGPKTAEES